MAQLLLELPFVPMEPGRLRMCTAQAQQLHPALLDRLPRVRQIDVAMTNSWKAFVGPECCILQCSSMEARSWCRCMAE